MALGGQFTSVAKAVLLLDNAQFERGLSSSRSRFRSGTRQMEGDVNRLSRGVLSGSGAFTHLGRSIAFASSAFLGAAGLTAVVRTAISDAESYNVAQRQLDAQIRASGQSLAYTAPLVDVLNQRMAKLGFTNVETVGAYTRLLRATHSSADAFRLMQVTADLSAAKTHDLGLAALLVGKIYDGNVAALNRYGIHIAKGTSVTDALTIAQKQLAGQAAAAATPMDKLHAEVTILETAIGEQLLPTVNRIVTALGNWLGSSKNQARVQRDVKEAVHDAGVVIHDVSGIVKTIDGVTGGWKHTLELLLALKVGSVMSTWAGNISLLLGSGGAGKGKGLRGASAEAGLLGSRMRGLKLLGPIYLTVALEILLNTKSIRKHSGLIAWLDKHGAPGLFGSIFGYEPGTKHPKGILGNLFGIGSGGPVDSPSGATGAVGSLIGSQSNVVQKALQLGVGSGGTYKWGGGHSGVAKPGTMLDCSGYVYQVFTQSGFKGFPGSSSQQWFTDSGPNWTSRRLNSGQAQPGDVVFMVGSDPPSPGHVGIVTAGSGLSAQVMQYYSSGKPPDIIPLSSIGDLVGIKRFFLIKKGAAAGLPTGPVTGAGGTTTTTKKKKGPLVPASLRAAVSKAEIDKSKSQEIKADQAIVDYLKGRIAHAKKGSELYAQLLAEEERWLKRIERLKKTKKKKGSLIGLTAAEAEQQAGDIPTHMQLLEAQAAATKKTSDDLKILRRERSFFEQRLRRGTVTYTDQEGKKHTIKLDDVGRLAIQQSLNDVNSKLTGILGNTKKTADAMDFFTEAGQELKLYGSNITGRHGILSPQDARAYVALQEIARHTKQTASHTKPRKASLITNARLLGDIPG